MAPSPVAPGETVLLFGASVGSAATVSGVQLGDGDAGAPPGVADCVPDGASAIDAMQASDLSIKATMPAQWTAGVYALVVTNAAGASAPVVINRPRIDWIHAGVGGTVVPSAKLDVYGRSFGAAPHAWLVDGGGTATDLGAGTSDGYAATFAVPAIADGSYSLYVHAGKGGRYGFSSAFAVTVQTPVAWPTTVYPIAPTANDDQTLATAIANATSNHGGIIEFQTGTYTLTHGVTIPPNTIVKSKTGNRADVTINFTEAQIPFPYAFIGDSNFVVEDITVVSNSSARLFQCPSGSNFLRDPANGAPQYQPNAPCVNAVLHDVSFTLTTQRDRVNNGVSTGTLTATDMVVINGDDSEISDSFLANSGGSAITISGADHMYITNNTLISGASSIPATTALPETATQTSVGGGDGIFSIRESAITGNTIGPVGNLGSAQTMYIEYAAHDLYIADNKIGPNLSNYGEGFSFDAPYYPIYLDTASVIAGRTITLPRVPNAAGNNAFGGSSDGTYAADELVGNSFVVVNGPGLGEYAEIVSNTASGGDGSTAITLDRDLPVAIDPTSVIEVANIKSKVVFARNAFHDTAVGAQLYAGAYDFIIDGNTGNTMEGTYCVGNDFTTNRSSTTGDTQRRFSRCYFNQWINNQMDTAVSATYPWLQSPTNVYRPYTNAFMGVEVGIAKTTTPAARGIPDVGNIVRDNRETSVSLGVIVGGIGGLPTLPTFGVDNIVENDQTTGVTTGVLNAQGTTGTLVRNNTCPGC